MADKGITKKQLAAGMAASTVAGAAAAGAGVYAGKKLAEKQFHVAEQAKHDKMAKGAKDYRAIKKAVSNKFSKMDLDQAGRSKDLGGIGDRKEARRSGDRFLKDSFDKAKRNDLIKKEVSSRMEAVREVRKAREASKVSEGFSKGLSRVGALAASAMKRAAFIPKEVVEHAKKKGFLKQDKPES